MARYVVECDTCGQNMDFYTWGGNSRDRQWRADNWSHECDECKQKRVSIENEKNAEKNSEEGLIPLIGSEKQIAWAETLRASFVQKSNELMEQSQKFYELLEKSSEEDEKVVAMDIMIELGIIDMDILELMEQNTPDKINFKITKVFENKSASFWIDRRGRELHQLLEEIEDEEIEIKKDLEKKLQKEAE